MSSLNDVICELLSKWPSSDSEDLWQARARLGGLIIRNLKDSSLRTVPQGSWRRASRVIVQDDVAKFLVDGAGTLPVIAHMRLFGGKWVLTRFDMQCPICFGVGVNDEQICTLCFGDGWGSGEDNDRAPK